MYLSCTTASCRLDQIQSLTYFHKITELIAFFRLKQIISHSAMKRKEVLEIIKKVGLQSPYIDEAIEEKVAKDDTTTNKDEADIKLNVSRFLAKFRQKYNKHNRMLARFVEKEYEWLEGDLYKPADKAVVAGPGRPDIPWDEASERTKRRKIQNLKENNRTIELASAAIRRSKDSPGQKDLGAVIKESVKNTQKVRDSIESADKVPVMMLPEDALALKIQCDLSDDQ